MSGENFFKKLDGRKKVFLLPYSAFKVWMYHYSREGQNNQSWPTVETIAKECGIDPGTVKQARALLKKYGWLKQTGWFQGKNGKIPKFTVDEGTVPEVWDADENPTPMQKPTLLDNSTETPVDNPPPTQRENPPTEVDAVEVDAMKESDAPCPWCNTYPCKHPRVCENRRDRVKQSGAPTSTADKPVSATRTTAAAPVRKVGFDPHSIEPFDGWTVEQITEVLHYHWEYLPTTDEEPWWRDHTNTEEYFKRNFAKMAQAVKPIPGKKPKKSARVEPIQRIHDPNCAVCHGQGIDALRPANLCACVRFKNAEGQFVSFYDYACKKHGKQRVDAMPAATVASYKKLNLPEVVHA